MALGLGTMIGWKRIVVTVGERIGKTYLSYGQGAAAELVAMATIGAADVYGLPVLNCILGMPARRSRPRQRSAPTRSDE